jgi:hypothetical protein
MHFQSATSGPYKIIQDKLLKCPQCATPFVEEVGRKVLQGNFIGFQVIFHSFVHQNDGQCTFSLGIIHQLGIDQKYMASVEGTLFADFGF